MFSKLQPITNNSSNNNEAAAELKKKKKKKSIIIIESPVEKRKKKLLQQQRKTKIYTALLSHVSKEFLKRINLSTLLFKDGIEYHDVFNGSMAVVTLYTHISRYIS